MIKALNKYFSFVMVLMVLLTVCIFNLNQKKIQDFINKSTEHTLVISQKLDEKNKDIIKNKLQNLTFQNVEIEEFDDKIYVKIKCPPEKSGFFSKWLLDKKWNE